MKSEIKQSLILIQETWEKRLNEYCQKHDLEDNLKDKMSELLTKIIIQRNHLGKNPNIVILTVEYMIRNGYKEFEEISTYKLSILRLGHSKNCDRTEYESGYRCCIQIHGYYQRSLMEGI